MPVSLIYLSCLDICLFFGRLDSFEFVLGCLDMGRCPKTRLPVTYTKNTPTLMYFACFRVESQL